MKLDWGKSLVLFFIMFLSLGVIFIVFSLRQNNDLVTEDYYEKGANYSTEIKINARSAVYEDSISFKESEAMFEIMIAPELAIKVSTFDVFFFRPSDQSMDVKLRLDASTNLKLEKEYLSRGRYEMHLSWEMAGEKYRIKKDLMIK